MSQDAAYYRLAMRIFSDFGITIAVPVVLAVIAGGKLDEQFDTGVRYLVILLVLSFIFTGLIVYRKAKFYERLYSKLMSQEQRKDL